MEWLLYIVGGILVLGILIGTGILNEFFIMLFTCLISCGIGALICYLITDSASPGSDIGMWTGFTLYVLYCLSRIISPTKTMRITGDEDGNVLSRQVLSDRGEGVAGLVMLIILVCIYLFK